MEMLMETHDRLLDESQILPAHSLQGVVPGHPGYYAIWVDSADSLPAPFSGYLNERDSRLLYVGIASKSLSERLVEQEFRHKRAATFFRSLGAVLGYKPPAGSLVGKRNQNNYRFSKSDTQEIVRWIESHLLASFVTCDTIDKEVEKNIIERVQPLLNIQHNPRPCALLSVRRNECRQRAVSALR